MLKKYFVVGLLLPLTLVASELDLSTPEHHLLQQMRLKVHDDPIGALSQLLAMDLTRIEADKTLYHTWLLRLAEGYNQTYQFDQFDKLVTESNALFTHSENNSQQALSQLYSAIILRRKGEYQAAIKKLNEAISTAETALAKNEQISALIELSYVHALEEQYESSLLVLQQGFVLATNASDQLLLGQVYEMYGVLYAYMGRMAESIEHYQKSQHLYESLGYPYFIAENAFGMATTYRQWQKWDQAIAGFEKYHQAVKSMSSDYTQFFYRYGLGMTHAMRGDCSLAMPIIKAALAIDEFPDYRAELFKKNAICAARQGDFKAAENAIGKARAIFQSLPALRGTSWEIEIDKVIARVSALKGNHELAYQKLESYYQNLQKIQQARTSGRLEKLKLELNQERERLEYAMLEKQSEVQRLTLNNQTRKIELQRFWLFGSISFIAVILSFLWWQLSASRQLKSLAITDELTGLTNRRYIFSAIERILHNKPGTHFHHSLMLIDLDDLKPINDGYGHQEGDRALKMVAKVGQKVSREGDIFARIGGDEFMLLLTRTDKKLETMVAQRIIETIARSPIKTRSGELLPISVSIGIVSIEDLSRSPEQVYNQVDQALYRAKSAGRNGFSR